MARVVETETPADEPPFRYPASIATEFGMRPQVGRSPLRRLLESELESGMIGIGGYLDDQIWWKAEIRPPRRIVASVYPELLDRVNGSRPWSPQNSREWWAAIGSDSSWAAGISEDKEWNVCAADGYFDSPYLTVNEIGTVTERRRRGLATRLLDQVRSQTGLQPLPEIVNPEEDEGLAVEFWDGYLPTELSTLIRQLSEAHWGHVTELLRNYRKSHRGRHDRIVFLETCRSSRGLPRGRSGCVRL